MKRNISIVLVVILAFSVFTGNFTYSKAEGNDYSYVDVIKYFNLMDSENDTDFLGNEYIDRETAAKYVLNLRNIRSYNNSQEIYFSDVSKYSENYPVISTAVNSGIIKGDIQGTFRGKDNTTYSEAYTMILRALGYGVLVENGSDTYDILSVTTGLSKGIKPEGQYITRYDFAKAIYNTFEIGIIEQTGFGDDNTFNISKDKTSLSYHNLKKGEGIVNANDTTSLYYSATHSEKGMVVIGNEEFKAGATNASSLLGFNVEYYYEYFEGSDDIKTINYIIPKGNKESTYELKQNFYTEENGNLCYVSQSGKKVTINMNKSAVMLLNGWAVPYDIEVITNTINTGEFTLISHPTSSYVNVVVVKSYVNDIIQKVDYENEIIYLKHTKINEKNYIEFPYGDTEKDIRLTRNSANCTLSDFKTNDVISYYVSGNGKIITIHASDKVASGIITLIEKENGTTVVINSISYPVTSLASPNNILALNNNVTAYLTFDGKIADFDLNTSRNYGFVLKSLMVDADGGEKVGVAKILKVSGKSESIYFAENITVDNGMVTVNNNKYIPHTSVISMIGTNGKNLIVYDLNSEGKIKNINFPKSPSGTNYKNQYDDQNLFILSHTKKTAQVYSGKTLDGIIVNNTILFEVPDALEPDVDDCKVSIGGFIRSRNYAKTNIIKFYDVGFDGRAKVALSLSAPSGDYDVKPTDALVVSRIVDAVDKEGAKCKKLYYYDAYGNENGILVASETVNSKLSDTNPTVAFNKVKAGDIISFAADSDGKLYKYTVIYQNDVQALDEGVLSLCGDGVGNNRTFLVLKGKARYLSETELVIEYDLDGNPAYEPFSVTADSKIAVINSRTGNIKFESLSRIVTTNFAGGEAGNTIIVMGNRNALGGAWIYE